MTSLRAPSVSYISQQNYLSLKESDLSLRCQELLASFTQPQVLSRNQMYGSRELEGTLYLPATIRFLIGAHMIQQFLLTGQLSRNGRRHPAFKKQHVMSWHSMSSFYVVSQQNLDSYKYWQTLKGGLLSSADQFLQKQQGHNFINVKIGTILTLSYPMGEEPAPLKMVLNLKIQQALQACSWWERAPEIHNTAISQTNGCAILH